MSLNFELPSITSQDPAQQLAEIKSFLWQTVEKLNWAFNYINIEGTDSDEAKEEKAKATAGDFVTDLSAFEGTNYKAIIRTWSSGMKEAFLKTSLESYNVTNQIGSVWNLPAGLVVKLRPLPPGFTKSNIIACVPSIAIQRKSTYIEGRDVVPYARLTNDSMVEVDIISPQSLSGANVLEGYIMLYLACK